MNHEPPSAVILHGDELARAVTDLPALDLRVLMYLAVEAAPYSGRVWHPIARIASDLGMQTNLVEGILEHLATADLIEQHPRSMKDVLTIELGPILLRDAPEHLPFEPDV